MKKQLINLIIKITLLFSKILYSLRIGRLIIDTISSNSMDRVINIKYKNFSFMFISPNYLNHWRLKTFALKEPETLDWIDNIDSNSVLWDIGANVGLYSIYAAKTKNCNVHSFEPSVFNLELLARNIFQNKLTNKINILPFPLTSTIGINKLNMTSTTWGGAISTFGSQAIGHDGKIMNKKFEFTTIGLTMDSAVELLNLPKPDYIKMDVDGIEHMILAGGLNTLKSVKSVLIEINDDFDEQRINASKILQSSGLVLSKKLHSDLVENMIEFGRTYNQIWTRP